MKETLEHSLPLSSMGGHSKKTAIYYNDGYMLSYSTCTLYLKRTTLRAHCKVNCGLWVIKLCHCMFSCNKHTTLAGDADDGQAVHVCAQGM